MMEKLVLTLEAAGLDWCRTINTAVKEFGVNLPMTSFIHLATSCGGKLNPPVPIAGNAIDL